MGELLGDRRVRLGGLGGQSREPEQPDADDRQAVVDRGADLRVARLGEQRRDVPRRGLEGLGRDAALGLFGRVAALAGRFGRFLILLVLVIVGGVLVVDGIGWFLGYPLIPVE